MLHPASVSIWSLELQRYPSKTGSDYIDNLKKHGEGRVNLVIIYSFWFCDHPKHEHKAQRFAEPCR